MDSKKLIGSVSVVSFVFGLLGGTLGAWLFSGNESDPTFKTVTVTDSLIVKTEDSTGAGCKLLPDGTATLTGGLIANQVRGQVFSGQSFLASTNPLSATLGDQKVMAQMTADPNSGGQLIARSREATLVPAQGAPALGNMAVIAFNRQNGKAEIFTQDVAAGDAGRSFMLSMRPRAAQPSDTASKGPATPVNDQTAAQSHATRPAASGHARSVLQRNAPAAPSVANRQGPPPVRR